LQVITLSEVGYHYKKFALELFNMRLKGDNGDAIYREAQTYRAKSAQVAVKLNELWNDSATMNELFAFYAQAQPSLKPSLFAELRSVSRIAPRERRGDFINALAKSQAVPSERLVAQAREELKQNPFDESRIEHLKSIEEKKGSQIYVAFLEGRLGQVQGGKK
jgi:hypothetical protein